MEEKVLESADMKVEGNKDKEQQNANISPEIDAKINVIKKNIDFCMENGCPDALKEGGKYFTAFSNLINTTVAIEITELKKLLFQLLPINKEKHESAITGIINNILDNRKFQLTQYTEAGDVTGIINEMNNIKKIYAEHYVKYQVDQLII